MIFTACQQPGRSGPADDPAKRIRALDYEGEMGCHRAKGRPRIRARKRGAHARRAMTATMTAAFPPDCSSQTRNSHPARISWQRRLRAVDGHDGRNPDISKQTIATRLNGVEYGRADLGPGGRDGPAMIAYCSTSPNSCPATSFVTGTTGCVGAIAPRPLWMKDGDCRRSRVSGIGILRNPVKTKPAARGDARGLACICSTRFLHANRNPPGSSPRA